MSFNVLMDFRSYGFRHDWVRSEQRMPADFACRLDCWSLARVLLIIALSRVLIAANAPNYFSSISCCKLVRSLAQTWQKYIKTMCPQLAHSPTGLVHRV